LEVRDWRCEVGGARLEVRDWRCEVGGARLEVRGWRCVVGGARLVIDQDYYLYVALFFLAVFMETTTIAKSSLASFINDLISFLPGVNTS